MDAFTSRFSIVFEAGCSGSISRTHVNPGWASPSTRHAPRLRRCGVGAVRTPAIVQLDDRSVNIAVCCACLSPQVPAV